MALLTVCQHTFQNVTAYEEAVEDVAALKVNVQECYTEITKTSEQIQSSVRETYISKSEMETIQQDFQTSITESSTEIRMDFQSSLDVVSGCGLRSGFRESGAAGGIHPFQGRSHRARQGG